MFKIIVLLPKEAKNEDFLSNAELTIKSIGEHFYYKRQIHVLTNMRKISHLSFGEDIKIEKNANIPEGLNSIIQAVDKDCEYIMVLMAGVLLQKNITDTISRIIKPPCDGGSCKIVNRQGFIIQAGIDKDIFPFTRFYGEPDSQLKAIHLVKVGLLPIEFMVFSKKAFDKVGSFNPSFKSFMWNIEWGMRAEKLGLSFYYFPFSLIAMANIWGYEDVKIRLDEDIATYNSMK